MLSESGVEFIGFFPWPWILPTWLPCLEASFPWKMNKEEPIHICYAWLFLEVPGKDTTLRVCL